MKYRLILIILIITAFVAKAQMLEGTVSGEASFKRNELLQSATIFWQGSTIGTFSDSTGKFKITYPDSLPANLIISYLGFNADTILVSDPLKDELKINLKPAITLNEVEVKGKRQSSSYSTMTPINTEIVTSKELQKAACCNLSESFETNASVDVNFTDAVSGAKQIQMLGLDGIYTQILSENLPLIRGLSSSYGLNYTPGTWVESILITKGTGSVVNGYESITGQLQIELPEPELSDKLFVNGYASNNGRYEGNVHFSQKINEQLSSILFLHASETQKHIDQNNDGFVDNPLTKQLNLLNRWHFSKKEKLEGQFGFKLLSEDRQGGQTLKIATADPVMGIYKINIQTKMAEVFAKTGFLFPGKPYKSIGLMASARRHEFNSIFGLRKYAGEQSSGYFNSIYQTIVSDTRHKIKFGGSLIYDDYNESFNDSAFARTEVVPGTYAEYTYSNAETVSLVAGVRSDYHNLYGLITSPRVHFKYNFNPVTAVRLSAGRGFRVANVFVENASVFASSRAIVISGPLQPEIAGNGGITLTRKFLLAGRDASFNVDFYRTEFENQVVIDREDVDKVMFYNLNGRSYSNSLQTELNLFLYEGLEMKAAYKFYDVKSTYSGKLLDKPLVSRNRAFLNVAYETPMEKWKFDYTLKWFGKARIPDTSENSHEFHLNTSSDSYFLSNAQITRAFKYFDIYAGAENIFNFMQHNPILAAAEPFGENFDASLIWGPVMGRTMYIGFRYTLK